MPYHQLLFKTAPPNADFVFTRIALLSLTYSFGNQKLKGERQRRIGSDDETKRAN